jgi:DNA primase
VPFVRFRVERELSTGDLGSAEGKDAVIAALRPVFAQIPPSALREELVALVADRTDVAPALVGSWLAQGAGSRAGGSAGAAFGGGSRGGGPRAGRPRGGGSRGGAGGGGLGGYDEPIGAGAGAGPGPRDERGAAGRSAAPAPFASLDAAARAERAFLAQCLAVPSAGEQALADLDLDSAFTSDLTRRAAHHLREQLHAPASGIGEDDSQLAALIAELSVRASLEPGSTAALEGESLNLELLRLERAIASARNEGRGDVAPLVARREELRHRRDRAIERAMAETQPVE